MTPHMPASCRASTRRSMWQVRLRAVRALTQPACCASSWSGGRLYAGVSWCWCWWCQRVGVGHVAVMRQGPAIAARLTSGAVNCAWAPAVDKHPEGRIEPQCFCCLHTACVAAGMCWELRCRLFVGLLGVGIIACCGCECGGIGCVFLPVPVPLSDVCTLVMTNQHCARALRTSQSVSGSIH